MKIRIILIAVLIMVVSSGVVYAGEVEDKKKARELEAKVDSRFSEIHKWKAKFLEMYTRSDSDEEVFLKPVRHISEVFSKHLASVWDKKWIGDLEFYHKVLESNIQDLVDFYDDAIARAEVNEMFRKASEAAAKILKEKRDKKGE